MAEAEPQDRSAKLLDFLTPGGPQPPRQKPYVGFDRRELNTILDLYGRTVAAGARRAYATDVLTDRARFPVSPPGWRQNGWHRGSSGAGLFG